MKKLHVVLMALVAVFAFSAVVAGSASAEVTLLAEWLVKGTGVAGGANFEAVSGEELTVGHLGLAEVTCKGFFDGLVEANGFGVVESVLNAAKELTSGTALTGLGLVCEPLVTCEKTADIELWAVHLPWLTVTYLMEDETFLTLFYKENGLQPGFVVKCLVLGVEIDEECSGETSALDTNEAADVLGKFTPAELETEKLEATCKGEAQKGFQTGSGLTELVNKEVLAVSE
jgi:hypothetical protein